MTSKRRHEAKPIARIAGHAGFCQLHDRALYPDRKTAKKAKHRYPETRALRIYPCSDVAGYYHLGALPAIVRGGASTVREYYAHYYDQIPEDGAA